MCGRRMAMLRGTTRLDTGVCGTSMQVRIAMRTRVHITFCCYNEARHFMANEECNSAESEIDRLPRVKLFLLVITTSSLVLTIKMISSGIVFMMFVRVWFDRPTGRRVVPPPTSLWLAPAFSSRH